MTTNDERRPAPLTLPGGKPNPRFQHSNEELDEGLAMTKALIFDGLAEHFDDDRRRFDELVDRLGPDDVAPFLRGGVAYMTLVKRGDWKSVGFSKFDIHPPPSSKVKYGPHWRDCAAVTLRI